MIDNDVGNITNAFYACQCVSPSVQPVPLQMTRMPINLWEVIHVDMCDVFPTDEYILDIADECSLMARSNYSVIHRYTVSYCYLYAA